ncbi:MAG: hypothetical protein HQK77_16120 [Desulfobacterales bacterium]|nr:hypothetical protein [Desulfobacterales bacterium]
MKKRNQRQFIVFILCCFIAVLLYGCKSNEPSPEQKLLFQNLDVLKQSIDYLKKDKEMLLESLNKLDAQIRYLEANYENSLKQIHSSEQTYWEQYQWLGWQSNFVLLLLLVVLLLYRINMRQRKE